MLGAGGAAKAISFYIAPLVCCLVLVNRSESPAADLASSLRKRFKTNAIAKRKLTREILLEELNDAEILINATPVGMNPNADESLADRNLIHPHMTVFDLVYSPVETKLLKEASASGAKVISGLKMLAYQGSLAFEIWTGRKPPVNFMLKALTEAVKEIQ